MNINEALIHDVDHPAFTNFVKKHPAKYDLNSSMQDEHGHLDDLHGDVLPTDREAINRHTMSSWDINRALRDPNTSDHWVNRANTLSSAINRAEPLDREHHIYSSLSVHNPENTLNHSDGVFKNKHFLSGTIDPMVAVEHDNLKHMADRYAGDFDHSDNTHILHFHLPEGYTGGRYVAKHSEYPGEHEFLLDRDQKWKLHDVHTIHDPTNPHRTRTIWTVKPHQSDIQEIYQPWDRKKFQRELNPKEGIATGYLMDKEWYGNKYKVPKEAAEHHKHMNALFEDHYKNDHVVRSVKHYTEGGSHDINPALIRAHRLGKDPSEAHTVPSYGADKYDDLKKSFKDVPKLDHDVHAYSGLGFDPTKHFEEHGGIFHSPAFVSTSLNPMVASGIGATHSNRDTPMHIIHFHLPKGYGKALYAGNPKANEYYIKQHELILDHNQKFKKVGEMTVSAKSKYGKHTAIIHTVVPHDYNINEEVYHDGEEFFHDAFRKKVVNFAWHKAANKHTNPDVLKKHHEELAAAAMEKAKTIPSSLVDKQIPTDTRAHKHIAKFTRSSEAINHSLIHGDGDHTDWANGISEAIKTLHNPNAKELHVYSGTNHPHLISGNASVGDVLHTPAFTSTSIDHTVAKSFGWNHVDPAKPSEANHHVIHFELPEGYSKGTYIQPHSWLPHEKEYLLDKDQKWKIKDKQEYRTRDESLKEIKRTVWTVVPHNHDIHEALEHDPNLLRSSGENYTDSSGPWLANRPIKDYSAKSWRKVNAQREAAHKVGLDHADHLSTYHSFAPSADEHDLLNRYTRTLSARITHALLTTPEAHEKSLEGHDQSHIQSLNEIRAEHLADADRVSHAIDKHSVPLREPAHVYSGLGYDPRSHFENNGGVIHIPAFTSTSLDAKTPRGFTVAHTDPTAHKMTTKDIKPKIKLPKMPKPSDDIFGWEPDHSGSLSGQEATHWTKHHFEESADDRHILHFELPEGYKKGLYIAPHSRYAEENEYLLDKGQKWKLKKHEVKNSMAVCRTTGDKYTSGADDLAPHELKTRKTKTRTHIWTVVPHEDNVNEGLVHIPQLFGHSSTQLYGTHNAARLGKVNSIQNKMSTIVATHDAAAGEHMHANYTTDHLSPEEKYTIGEYTGSKSGPTNRHLLKPLTEQVKEHAKSAYDIAKRYPHFSDEEKDEMLRKWSPLHIHGNNIKKLDDIFKHKAHTLKEDLHVYSGIGFDPTEHFEAGHGVFHSPAFISSSVGVSTPRSFGQAFASKDAHHDQWDDEYTSKRDNANVVKQGSRSEQDKHIIHFHLPKGYNGGMHIAPDSKFPEEREFLLNRNQKWKLINHEVHTVRDHTRYRTFSPSRKSVWDSSVELPAGRKYESYLTKQRNHIWTVVPHDHDVNEAKIHTPDYFSGVTYNKINWSDFSKTTHKHSHPLRDSEHSDNIADEQAEHIKVEHMDHDYEPLSIYTMGSHAINTDAIHGRPNAHYEGLDKTIEAHSVPLHEDMHVYSGAGFDPTDHFEKGKGVIHLPAYTSTSLSPLMATGFGIRTPIGERKRNHYTNERHILHFHLPAGSQHGAYIDHLSTHDGEKEYLLHRGKKWKLTNHEVVKSRDVTKYTNTNSHDNPVHKDDNITHIWSLEPHND